MLTNQESGQKMSEMVKPGFEYSIPNKHNIISDPFPKVKYFVHVCFSNNIFHHNIRTQRKRLMNINYLSEQHTRYVFKAFSLYICLRQTEIEILGRIRVHTRY